jgi:hypothetical protein
MYFQFLIFIILNIFSIYAYDEKNNKKIYNTPAIELMQSEIYLSVSRYGETIVAYSSKGTDLKTDDYLTHVDGIRLKTGSINEILLENEKEIVMPILDDKDLKFGGKKLKGFITVKYVEPRRITSRRGEIFFDLEEGGSPPTLKLGF